MRGRFAGFFRDIFGKRRMVLRVGEEEVFLKVPKELRHALDGQLAPGSEVELTGSHEVDEETGTTRHLVSQVRRAGEAAPVACPIRVCAKKSCWRSGGKEFYHAMERHLKEAGLSESVKLEAVGCLDHCKRGPNVECGGRVFHHCSSRDLDRVFPVLETTAS